MQGTLKQSDYSTMLRAPDGARVLIVEDNPEFQIALQDALGDNGYRANIISTGNEAMRALSMFRPDLVLLDVRLPGVSGLDVCERIRAVSDVPVVIFSAVHDADEKMEAFSKGADDYVQKTAPLDELLARISAALRRSYAGGAGNVADVYRDDAVEIDFNRSRVRAYGAEVDLTPTQYKLLEALVKNAGHPVPASQLLRRVWGPEYRGNELVKWHVGHLRQKLEQDPDRPRLIVTRRGFGYVYSPPAKAA